MKNKDAISKNLIKLEEDIRKEIILMEIGILKQSQLLESISLLFEEVKDILNLPGIPVNKELLT